MDGFGHRQLSFGAYELADVGKSILTDAANKQQVFGPAKRAILNAKCNDRFGSFASYVWEPFEAFGGRGVDVDGIGRYHNCPRHFVSYSRRARTHDKYHKQTPDSPHISTHDYPLVTNH